MDKQFIPYELALELKELGFDEECLAYYDSGQFPLFLIRQNDKTKHTNLEYDINELYKGVISAPLWQEAFDWFREKHKIDSHTEPYYTTFNGAKLKTGMYRFNLILSIDSYNSSSYKSYEEARQACLKKLIELCKNK